MILSLKKCMAYVAWPFIWAGICVVGFVAALGPAWREYRWNTAGGLETLRDGFEHIRNYKE